ncbi:hypothetical protein SAMN05720354_13234 [Nitrosospira sp. Nsp1]|nr:hypothetical protein [Nitrosospira sp. Nsp1]SCX62767.1 hypothetical protein SAMN05720354_13234 [Nitrosospira sp. Nsp1]
MKLMKGAGQCSRLNVYSLLMTARTLWPCFGSNGAVHYQYIPIVDVGAGYGVANHPEKESGGLVAHRVRVEIERGFRYSSAGEGRPEGMRGGDNS